MAKNVASVPVSFVEKTLYLFVLRCEEAKGCGISHFDVLNSNLPPPSGYYKDVYTQYWIPDKVTLLHG